MKRLKYLLLIGFFMLISSNLTAQYQDPSSYTSHYNLRMWAQGDNPSADSLNQNWKDLDTYLWDLVVVADPRYFEWKTDSQDTLTLKTTDFGTIGFATDENLYIPIHDRPYSNLGNGAIGYNSEGYLVFYNTNLNVDKYDTLLVRRDLRDDYLENDDLVVSGNWEFTGIVEFKQSATIFHEPIYADSSIIFQENDAYFTNANSYSFDGIVYLDTNIINNTGSGTKGIWFEEDDDAVFDSDTVKINGVLQYGELGYGYFGFQDSSITITTTADSTFYQITNSYSNLIGVKSANDTTGVNVVNDTLVISTAGEWQIEATVGYSGTNGEEYRIQIFKNGTAVGFATSGWTATGALENHSFLAQFDASVNDSLTIEIANYTDTDDPVIKNMNIMMDKID